MYIYGMTLEEALTEAQIMYATYISAEAAVLQGKSYTIGGRSLSREDLAEIRRGRQEWAGIMGRLNTGSTGPRVMRVVPRDC
jgi:hypothetical protein